MTSGFTPAAVFVLIHAIQSGLKVSITWISKQNQFPGDSLPSTISSKALYCSILVPAVICSTRSSCEATPTVYSVLATWLRACERRLALTRRAPWVY